MTTTSTHEQPRPDRRTRAARWALWLPGLLVALGAAAATAHGLYEVTVAAQVPAGIAWVYPVITDGLALVAYAATAQLDGSGRRYAWFVVVLAAGVSGLAQATYLAGGVHSAPAELRFGIGAWPAIAAAIVAHLLFLIAQARRPVAVEAAAHADDPAPDATSGESGTEAQATPRPPEPEWSDDGTDDERPTVQLPAVQPEPVQASSVQPAPVRRPGVQARASSDAGRTDSDVQARPAVRPVPSGSARARADEAARRFADEHGDLPTVSRLMELAEVSRGTAGEALKALRHRTAELHLVSDHTPKQAQQ